ncbi:MAG: type II secretion system protein GspM [Halioglobus sp.]
MNWIKSHQRSALICGLTLLFPVMLYLDVLLGVWAMGREYQADIDRQQPRIARMRGLIEHEDQLRESAGKVGGQVVNLVYPASTDQATVSATLQTEVRQILTTAGMSVSNSQVLRVREEEKFDYIGIKLTANGDVAALDAALTGLAAYMPLLLIESLDVYPQRVSRRSKAPAAQNLTATMQLLSLRAAE